MFLAASHIGLLAVDQRHGLAQLISRQKVHGLTDISATLINLVCQNPSAMDDVEEYLCTHFPCLALRPPTAKANGVYHANFPYR
jgi:hypothetical protein